MRIRLPLLFCLTCATVGAAYAQAPATDKLPDTMEARVQACIGCHGAQGHGVENVYFPRLAGKPAGYLYNQLLAFRDGRRKYVPMNYLLAYLPDPYLEQMAAYFAAQTPDAPATPASPASAQQLADGQRIVTSGLPAKGVPACSTCHGVGLNGREPGIPGLLGLRADYVSAQLGAWRYGIRTAVAPDCMQFVASSLSEQDVAAVSAWLASLPVPNHLRPASRDDTRLPLVCGSQRAHTEAP